MGKRKGKGTYIIILLLAILVIGGIVGTRGLNTFSDSSTVWVPQYWTGECEARPDNLQPTSFGALDGKGEFLECTTSGNPAKYWIPEGQTCDFTLIKTVSGLSTFSVYKCDLGVNERDVKDECEKQSAFLSDQRTFSVKQGEKLWIDPFNFLGVGKVNLVAKYPSYGLQVVSNGGFRPPITTSCSLDSYNTAVNAEVHLLQEQAFIVQPGVAVNSIIGLSPIRSSLIVSIPGVEGGDLIYVNKPNYYYQIKETKDGLLYADIQNQKFSASIECVPSTPGCDNGKVVNIEDTPCDEIGGILVGYSPVEGSTKYCKYDCIDDKLKVTSDCISFDTCDPTTEKLDYRTGECVSLKTPEPDEFPTIIWWIIGIMGFLILLMVIFIFATPPRTSSGGSSRSSNSPSTIRIINK